MVLPGETSGGRRSGENEEPDRVLEPCGDGDDAGAEPATSGERDAGLVEIVRAREEDADAIWRVTRAAYAPYRGRVRPPYGALRVTRRAIRFQIATGKRTYGVAKLGGKVVGVVRYRRRRRHIGISRLAVLPEYQGLGIGRRLLAWVETEARRLGVRELRAEVRTAVPEMQRYYERQGFRPIGYRSHPQQPNYLRIMRKRLDRCPRPAEARARGTNGDASS